MATTLSVGLSTYPHTEALISGEVKVPGYELDFSSSPTADPVAIFRTMSRELKWDVAEMGITTALCALEYGVPFRLVPVFVTRRFDNESFSYNVDKMGSPKDLEGQRIGLRSPNVPDVLWSLAILSDTYGVDLSKIEWVQTGDEHIEAVDVSKRCTDARGQDLNQLVESGEVAAIMAPYAGSSPKVRPFFSDVKVGEHAWYESQGYLPIHHSIVIRNDVLDAHPDLPPALYDALVEAKQPLLDRLAAGEQVLEHTDRPRHAYGFATTAELLTPSDPVPYGIEANRAALEGLLRYVVEQGLLSREYEVEEIFV